MKEGVEVHIEVVTDSMTETFTVLVDQVQVGYEYHSIEAANVAAESAFYTAERLGFSPVYADRGYL